MKVTKRTSKLYNISKSVFLSIQTHTSRSSTSIVNGSQSNIPRMVCTGQRDTMELLPCTMYQVKLTKVCFTVKMLLCVKVLPEDGHYNYWPKQVGYLKIYLLTTRRALIVKYT